MKLISTLKSSLFALLVCAFFISKTQAQIVINEASNRNYQQVVDEDEDSEDWIELYNSGDEAVDLFGYSLTDNADNITQWVFPHYSLQPGEFLLVFCSGKNRMYTPAFQNVAYITDYTPFVGWNEHTFDQAYEWDGVSDIVINTCSYSNTGYITNSVFNQETTNYTSSIASFNDGNEASCDAIVGETHDMRPVIRINGLQVGQGNTQNENTTYPAPYGNWYWSARNQMLYTAEELQTAGLMAGPFENLAWDVLGTDNVLYTYISISINQLNIDELSNIFHSDLGLYFHTNFELDSDGEMVYLFGPDQTLVHQLNAAVPSYEASLGSSPDASSEVFILQPPTPGYSNNSSVITMGIAGAPLFSIEPGVYTGVQNVVIYDTNNGQGEIHYTLDGNEPTLESPLYEGQALFIFQSIALRAKAFVPGMMSSPITSGAYLINVNHSTPVVSVVIDPDHLYGEQGIFENWHQDWERFAQVMYFDSSAGHPFVFARDVAMQIDGGAGGSRYHPQHSFRLELAKSAFNEVPVELPLLNNRPEREQYSRLYFRNGSNLWLTLPYKDAALTEMMCDRTNTYYSGMRPASVYINGSYFGLYEMREKLDAENYEIYDGAAPTDLLNQSYWYGLQLRNTVGDVSNYWEAWQQSTELNPEEDDYLEQIDAYYDMEYYTDYVISEMWVGNQDWPYNNIKIHRSDSTGNRWRFSTIDLELSLAPGSWSECSFNGIQHVYDYGPNDPFTGTWVRATQNDDYRIFFINRFADILNTAYRPERLLEVEQSHFDKWVVEMPNEYQRWDNPGNVQGLMNFFYDSHLALQTDLQCKSDIIHEQIEEVFGLDGQLNVTLTTIPEGAGVIHINTITPESLPWDGIYFHGVPVTITVEANEGYEFQNWLQNGEILDVLNPQYNGTIEADDITFTAVFEEVVSVEENLAGDQTPLVLYPNPGHNVLQIINDVDRINRIELVNANGQVVQVVDMPMSTHRYTLPVADMAHGVYMVRAFYLDGREEVVRWVKLP